jgi:hypothetical protein
MASEFDFQITAQHHQTGLLAEAAARRLLKASTPSEAKPVATGRRLQTLLRRLAGAPTFA